MLSSSYSAFPGPIQYRIESISWRLSPSGGLHMLLVTSAHTFTSMYYVYSVFTLMWSAFIVDTSCAPCDFTVK